MKPEAIPFENRLKFILNETSSKVINTFNTISIAKTTVKTWLLIFKIFLSVDQGGMFGLSMAKVMQFAEMKVKMMKSNQP